MKVKIHEGFETRFHELKLDLKMARYLLLEAVFSHSLVFLFLLLPKLSEFDFWAAKGWLLLQISMKVQWLPATLRELPVEIANLETGTIFNYPLASIFRSTTLRLQYQWGFAQLLSKVFHALLWSSWTWASIPLLLFYFHKRAKRQREPKRIRGSKLGKLEDQLNLAPKDGALQEDQLSLPFGPAKMTLKQAKEHCFLVGRSGTGKTVLVLNYLTALRQAGLPVLVHDFKGDYVSKFYDPDKDLIFNPFDQRGLKWNLFSEIRSEVDIESVAQSLIPVPVSGESRYWTDASRDLFAGILNFCIDNGMTNNAGLWRVLSLPLHDLADLLAKCPSAASGYKHIENPNTNASANVNATMMQYARLIKYLPDVALEDSFSFDLNTWLKEGQNFIFVSNNAEVQDALKPLLSLFMSQMGKRFLALPDSDQRFVQFIFDELGELNQMEVVPRLITQARSKGGAVLTAIQDAGQLDHLYGPKVRQTILNSCASSGILGLHDDVTADLMSRRIGDEEVQESTLSYSIGVREMKDGKGISSQVRQRRLVLPSELLNLPPMSGYFQLGSGDYFKGDFTWPSLEEKQPPFIMKDGIRFSEQRPSTPTPPTSLELKKEGKKSKKKGKNQDQTSDLGEGAALPPEPAYLQDFGPEPNDDFVPGLEDDLDAFYN